MARKGSGPASRLLGRLGITHLYVVGVVALIVVLGYPLLRGRDREAQ